MSKEENRNKSGLKNLITLSLGALGVVYGDIGTSPLYAIKEIFLGGHLENFSYFDVIGGISIVLWALILIISFKYVFFVLQADNGGEGGVFALYGLIHHLQNKSYKITMGLLIFAAGLLLGDGIITPAISVVSAVEGLSVVTSSLTNLIVPITIFILTGLFIIQSKGTHKIGNFFGPVMVVWFGMIGTLGF